MNLIYDKDRISTTDEITITIADLRDLIRAWELGYWQEAQNEFQHIVDSIAHKNRLKLGTLSVLENPDADTKFHAWLDIYEEIILEKHKIG